MVPPRFSDCDPKRHVNRCQRTRLNWSRFQSGLSLSAHEMRYIRVIVVRSTTLASHACVTGYPGDFCIAQKRSLLLAPSSWHHGFFTFVRSLNTLRFEFCTDCLNCKVSMMFGIDGTHFHTENELVRGTIGLGSTGVGSMSTCCSRRLWYVFYISAFLLNRPNSL